MNQSDRNELGARFAEDLARALVLRARAVQSEADRGSEGSDRARPARSRAKGAPRRSTRTRTKSSGRDPESAEAASPARWLDCQCNHIAALHGRKEGPCAAPGCACPGPYAGGEAQRVMLLLCVDLAAAEAALVGLRRHHRSGTR